MTTSVKKKTSRSSKNISLKFWVRIIVEKDEPGYYAYTPSLKGIHSSGNTTEEALKNASEAAALLLKVMIEDGDPIPIDLFEKPVKEKPSVAKNVVKSTVEEICFEV